MTAIQCPLFNVESEENLKVKPLFDENFDEDVDRDPEKLPAKYSLFASFEVYTCNNSRGDTYKHGKTSS